jgi:uncharacterized membrane protein
MVGLGFLTGATFSQAQGVNADGTVVVGIGNATGISGEAFRWTQTDGMQSVQAMLTAKGVSTTGWALTAATGVSADGRFIVGFGTDPNGKTQGWIADLGPTTFPFPLNAHLQLKVNPNPTKDAFALESSFTLGMKTPPIDPPNHAVMFQVGGFSATIPNGSFKQFGSLFTFAGVINGVNVQALIAPTGSMRYAFDAAAEHPDLTGTKNPVTVSLTIGSDSGTASVNALIFH